MTDVTSIRYSPAWPVSDESKWWEEGIPHQIEVFWVFFCLLFFAIGWKFFTEATDKKLIIKMSWFCFPKTKERYTSARWIVHKLARTCKSDPGVLVFPQVNSGYWSGDEQRDDTVSLSHVAAHPDSSVQQKWKQWTWARDGLSAWVTRSPVLECIFVCFRLRSIVIVWLQQYETWDVPHSETNRQASVVSLGSKSCLLDKGYVMTSDWKQAPPVKKDLMEVSKTRKRL